MLFGERLKETMQAKGLKQADLCRLTGLKSGAIAQYITKPDRDPRLSTVIKIADALDVSIDYMAGLTDNPSGMTDEELAQLKIDAEARALLRGFELLPPEGKTAIQDQVDFQLSKSKSKSSSTRMASPAVEVA